MAAAKSTDSHANGVSVQTTQADAPLVTINQITLSSRQLWTGIVAVVAMIGAGMAGGYLFVPARQTELVALRGDVQAVQAGLQRIEDAIAGMRRIRIAPSVVSRSRAATPR